MKKKPEIYKSVKIPHLRYTVNFMDMSKLKGVEKKGSGYTCVSGENEVAVFFEDIEDMIKVPRNAVILAHEIMHVIQIICDDFGMEIQTEQEHTAYLMTYLLDELLK